MSRSQAGLCSIALCLMAIGPSGCCAQEMVQELFPPPSPVPTQTPLPQVGHVGQRTEWGGWAITVTDVLRSSLNPRDDIPENYYPDERDYIGMDVTIERTADDRGYVDGEDFSLVDSSGEVYKGNTLIDIWTYDRGAYELGHTGEDRIVIPVAQASRGLKLRFTPYPDLPEPIEIALDVVKEPRQIDLREAIEMGLLTTDVRGMSLERIEIELQVSAELEEPTELSIAPGTMFLAPSPDLQTMVVRSEMVLFLEPDERELSVELKVACASMTLKAPEGGETYMVQIEPPAQELSKLLGLPEFKDSSFRLQQFAIWVITNNPSRGGFVGLGSGGQGSPPSADELSQIRDWFESAGIAIEDYAGLH
jgi:hypothetical protein